VNVLLVYPKSPRSLSIGHEDRIIRLASKKAYSPPLGLLTVAALLPDDWNIKLIDLTFQNVAESDWQWCEAVFTTGTLPQFNNIIDVIRESKNKGKIVAVGGPAAFHYPEEFLKAHADFVIIGEGEVLVPILLEKLEKMESGCVIKDESRADLTKSPVPRFDLLEIQSYVDMAMQFSRGCPFQCEFCDATQIFGRKVRTKDSSQILAELQMLYDLGWRREIYVVDDNLIGNPGKMKRVLDAMIDWMDDHRRSFEFFTHASINLANNPELMDLMVKAGFTTVYIGIESTDENALRIARKVQNTAIDLDAACKRINEAGLQIMAGTIIGMDGEKPDRDKSLIEFASRNNIPVVEVAQLYAYPGTALWKRLGEENRLLYAERDDLVQCNNLKMNFVPTRSSEDIQKEFLNAMERLYDRSAFLDRAFNHFLAMRPSPSRFYPGKLQWNEIKILLITLFQWGVVRNTRAKFWFMLFKAYMHLDTRRFFQFIRSCIALEHYVDLERECKSTLEPDGKPFDTVSLSDK
jgi:radical SAM superfamily enzyme YgiQ (UPF0313 family)